MRWDTCCIGNPRPWLFKRDMHWGGVHDAAFYPIGECPDWYVVLKNGVLVSIVHTDSILRMVQVK